MTAYGALFSLKNTIDYILHSSHFNLVEPSLHIIQPAYNELRPLQEILERLDSTSKSRSRKKVNALDGRIKDLIWEFEDLLESHVTNQILSQSSSNEVGGERDVFLFSIDLRRLQDAVPSFIHTLRDMERNYTYELENMAEDNEGECVSSSIGLSGTKSKMIGLSDQFQKFKRWIMGYWGCEVYAFIGMAGVGKTTLARQLFEDPEIVEFFDHRVWVTVSRKPQLSQLSRGILAQLYGDTQRLEAGTKCLIVLDDAWDAEELSSLIHSLPYIKDGLFKIIVTTRDRQVIEGIINFPSKTLALHIKVVRFLNEEESKELLCEKVFGEEICPPQLDKAATEIAKKCEGLPLMIVAVADILSKSQNRDPAYWDEVAEERNSVFTDAYDEISKVLFPSYDYLPQHLKMPFLFMGVFPKDYDTPPSKIINMFIAEGWFPNTHKRNSFHVQRFESTVCLYLGELCRDKNLVLFNQKSIFWREMFVWRGTLFGTEASYPCPQDYKTCWLHSSWRYVCRGESRKNKFYHVLNKLIDAKQEGLRGQRGLCLENNILFGIKEFYKLVRLNCASSTRSLLFFGPYHQYPIPIDVGFRLLRELDARTQRFYTFPTEILTLVQLKYLALTCNREIPTTISKLFNLRVLIIHPHINVKYYGDPSYIPIQIWDMQELEHIEILGKSLIAPVNVVSLEKLSTLVGLNASICTILELSSRIPNINKLGLQIELTPYDDHNDLLSCFACISKLESLKTLKCSIINPVAKCGYVVPATPSSLMLPHGLEKLHLSGMGFPWEYMDVIGSLSYLKVLKLRSYAFRGSKWEAQEKSFSRLEFLLIEDTDLVCLDLRSGWFEQLRISMKHCYKLEEIHLPLSDYIRHGNMSGYFGHGKIELVDCNPLALTCAKQMKLHPYTLLDVTAYSSFDKKPVIVKFQRHWT